MHSINTAQQIHYNNIPNCLMGKVSGLSVPEIPVRLMFPHMVEGREDKAGNHVDAAHMKLLYELALLPSVNTLLAPELRTDWPLRFPDEVFRAQRTNGTMVFTPHPVQAEDVNKILKLMYEATLRHDELSWAQDFFLYIQVQGTKQSTRHTLFPEPDEIGVSEEQQQEALDEHWRRFGLERASALAKSIHPFNALKINPDNWFADVATTVRLNEPGCSLFISAEKHAWLLGHMSSIAVADIQRDMDRKKDYSSDEVAHLGTLAGFRMSLPGEGSDTGVVYMQGYTTDKAIVALKDNGKFAKNIEPADVFRAWPSVRVEFFQKMLNAFEAARRSKAGVQVRIESRVYWDSAFHVHTRMSSELLKSCLVKVSTDAFW